MTDPAPTSEVPPARSPARSAAVAIVLLSLLATATPTLLACFARRHWFLDNLTSFTVQYAIASAACLVALVLLRVRRWPLLASIALAINIVRLMPHDSNAAASTGPPLRLLSANVNFTNVGHDRFLTFVRETDPDIVLVLEADHEWTQALEALRDRWPYTVVVPRDDPFGIALYSRVPFDSTKIVNAEGTGFPSIVATITHDGGPLTVIGTHPPPPNFAAAAASRDRQFAELAKLTRGISGEVVLMGDLNVSPWSPHFRDLLRAGNLSDTRRGLRPQATWPTFCPPLMTPIDHALVSPGLAVASRRVGPDVGSDHRPIIVEPARRR